MKGSPVISVVTVVYNDCVNIENTIKSVINQSYKNIEYIIQDGGSTDGTLELINKYNEQITSIESNKDNGIYDAMNKAVTKASGDYVIFMNCGDEFSTNTTLEDVANGIDDNIDVIYGHTILFDGESKKTLLSKNYGSIHWGMNFCHQSVFVKTCLLKFEKFDTRYGVAADYDFFMKLYQRKNISFLQLDLPIAIYDTRGVSNSMDTILEQMLIHFRYKPLSIGTLGHFLKFVYYNCTRVIKLVLPEKIVERLKKLKS